MHFSPNLLKNKFKLSFAFTHTVWHYKCPALTLYKFINIYHYAFLTKIFCFIWAVFTSKTIARLNMTLTNIVPHWQCPALTFLKLLLSNILKHSQVKKPRVVATCTMLRGGAELNSIIKNFLLGNEKLSNYDRNNRNRRSSQYCL